VLARHRMVYAALGDMMTTDIHALAMDARAPEEAKGNENAGQKNANV
jgi:BolA protein